MEKVFFTNFAKVSMLSVLKMKIFILNTERSIVGDNARCLAIQVASIILL